MLDQILHLAGVIAVAWLVTFALRAFPFVLFAGKRRELPPAVERVAAFISPVIIAGLIVYSYYGLYTAKYFTLSRDWAWPLLAGLLTIGLHLWKGNSLVSILAGTILYMCLVGLTGCASVPVEKVRSTIAQPLVHVTKDGIKYRDRLVLPQDVAKLLEKDGVEKDLTLHVEVDPDFDDTNAIWVFQHNCLNRAGYTRVMVMKGPRHGVSGSAELRDSFDGKGEKIPFEKRFQPQQRKVMPPSWKK